MSDREQILNRIREALKVDAASSPGSPPAHETRLAGDARSEQTRLAGELARSSPSDPRTFMPPVGASDDDRLALFQLHSKDLRTELIPAADLADAKTKLAELAKREGWKKLALHAGPLTTPACEDLAATDGPALTLLRTDQPYDVAELETCDAGVSECEALIAQTGSVMVTSRTNGGRALSVLPPHHVVLARRDQLVPDLGAAFARLRAACAEGNFPSMVSFITGPSRTGDIERILVLGAHGPKKLTVIVINLLASI